MAWQKSAWQLYQTASRAVLAVPGVKVLLQKWYWGQRLATLPRRRLVAALPNPIVTGDNFHFTLYLSARAYFFGPEALTGTYERDTVVVLQDLLSPGMTMVDLGAHLGYLSLVAARCVGPSGTVYAFEPQPETYDLLLKNIEANGYGTVIRPVRTAVSNTVGSTDLFQGEEDCGDASFYRTPGASVDKVVVETTTLDDFFAVEGWPTVHLVKMDIEGAEKVALEGMGELSARNAELTLIMEFNPDVQAAAGVTPEELFETLSALGFRKFSAIQGGLKPVSVPQDIPRLVRLAGDGYVNLICER